LDNQYLVVWKQSKQQEWLDEEKFETKEIIARYWKKLNKEAGVNTNEAPKRGRGRPPKRRGRPPTVKNVILGLTTLLLLSTCGAQTLNLGNNFSYCFEFNQARPIRTTDICRQPLKPIESEPAKQVEVVIFHHKKLNIYGTGHECFKVEHIWRYQENLLGEDTPPQHFEIPVNLHYYDCDEMVRTKQCKNGLTYSPMTCEGDYCFYDFIPNKNYRWWLTQESRGFSCKVIKKYIEAESIESILYNKPECKIYNHFCSLHNSIVIWPTSVIHNCPLELIDVIPMTRYSNDILVNKNYSMLLHSTGETFEYQQVCNFMLRTEFEFETTSEGFIIYMLKPLKENKPPETNRQKYSRESTISNVKVLKDFIRKLMPQSNRTLTDFNIKTKLTLAENDEKALERNIFTSEMIFLDCERFMLSLTLMKNNNDRLFEIKTLHGNKIIVFSKYGTIWAPKCIAAFNINTTNVTDKCYDRIEVTFRVDNKTKIGYLSTHDNIIREDAKIINCTNEAYTSLKNGTIVMRRNKALNIVHTLEFAALNRALMLETNITEEFHHYETLKQEIYSIKDPNNLVFEEGGTRVDVAVNDVSNNSISEVVD
jgi:hypothetical protein